jgi:hypothetical protein
MSKLRLFTSRFGAANEIIQSGAVPVRISIGHPRFRLPYQLVEKLPDLMPTRDMLEMAIEPYRSLFVSRLEKAGVESLRAQFEAIAKKHDNPSLVLLCFEDLRKPGQWCHRTMAARWLEHEGFDPIDEL